MWCFLMMHYNLFHEFLWTLVSFILEVKFIVHKIWICFITWKLSHITLKIVHLSHVILRPRNKFHEWCGWQLTRHPLSASSCVPLQLPLATITSPEHLLLAQVNHYQLPCEENGLMIGGESGKCGGGGKHSSLGMMWRLPSMRLLSVASVFWL